MVPYWCLWLCSMWPSLEVFTFARSPNQPHLWIQQPSGSLCEYWTGIWQPCEKCGLGLFTGFAFNTLLLGWYLYWSLFAAYRALPRGSVYVGLVAIPTFTPPLNPPQKYSHHIYVMLKVASVACVSCPIGIEDGLNYVHPHPSLYHTPSPTHQPLTPNNPSHFLFACWVYSTPPHSHPQAFSPFLVTPPLTPPSSDTITNPHFLPPLAPFDSDLFLYRRATPELLSREWKTSNRIKTM